MRKNLTRRRLLQLGGAATAASVVGGRPWAPALAAADDSTPTYLQRSAYAGLAGDRFQAGSSTLTLRSVDDLMGLAGRDDAFSLLFTGSGSALGTGIHSLSHPDLGSFALFLSPVDESGGDQHHEAIVNRSNLPARVTANGGASDGPAIAALDTPQAAPDRTPAKPPPARRHRSAVRRVRSRWLPRGLACHVELAGDSHVDVVSVWLRRGKRVVAAGSVRHVHGRHSVSLRLKTKHRLGRGRYVLEVLAVDRDGDQSALTQRLAVR